MLSHFLISMAKNISSQKTCVRYVKECAKIMLFFNDSFFKNFISKNVTQTFLIVKSQSKKYGICRYGNVIQYSWNVILFSLLSFTIVIQTIQKIIKLAYQLSFFLFLKFERSVVLRTRLTRKFCLRSFMTLICDYSFQFWIKTSKRGKKRSLINAPNKRRGHLLIFQYYSIPWSLLGHY